jgi:hypothetical protein
MALYAMVNTAGQFVANLVDWDGTTDYWVPPADHTMVLAEDLYCSPGFTYNGTDFLPPPLGTDGPLVAAALKAQAGK